MIDRSSLVGAIRDDAPCGEYLRTGGTSQLHDEVQSSANAARNAERLWQSLPLDDEGKPYVPEDQTAPPLPNWKAVVDGAVEILSQHSKDLWVASWMIEGLARTEGFTGLRDGFAVVSELAERYWGSLFPEPDEDDLDEGENTTILQIAGLDSVLPAAIKQIPIVNSESSRKLSSVDYIDAMEGEGVRITRDELKSAADSTDPEFFRQLQQEVDEARDEFLRMVAVLDEKCGSDETPTTGPPSSNIRQALDDVKRRIRYLAPESDCAPEDGDGQSDETAGEGDPGNASDKSVSVPGQIRTRGDAYEAIRKAADFLEATEPHSPVPTLLREIIQWRSMSFAELMNRLIEDSSARESLFRRTGVSEDQSDE